MVSEMFNRSGKSTKPGAGFAVLKAEELTVPKYPKPKILLIDLKDDTEALLRKAGYNVSSGSFGIPYRVPRSDEFQPVIPNGQLADVEEQEVIFIDLLAGDALAQPKGEKVTSEGENDWWASCSMGLIDPRPRLMAYYQNALNRILNHGGVFVIFADTRQRQEMLFGYSRRHYGLQKKSDIPFDNWSFLTVFDHIQFVSDEGTEITVADGGGDLAVLVSKHMNGAKFYSTLNARWYGSREWFSLANNKYGADVGGLLLPNNYRKGLVVVLPQLKHKATFISELLTSVLPGLVPRLFPHVEGAKWVERDEYEISSIIDLKANKKRIQEETKRAIDEIERHIQAERTRFQFLHDLIGGTDSKLVEAVKQTMTLIGFKKIVDLDNERKKVGESERDEDLQIHDYSPLLLVEVKGIGGIPSDTDALQVSKHIAPRMKQFDRRDVQALSIINHERHVPSLDRQNEQPFRSTILAAARKQDVGLLTAWDLFRLVRGFLRNKWTHEQVRPVIYGTGRILPIPAHYQFLGRIDEFWEKAGALSITVEEGDISLGSRVAYELAVDFVEEMVESIQIDGESVDKAPAGKVIGVTTTLNRDQAKKGVKVYRIIAVEAKG